MKKILLGLLCIGMSVGCGKSADDKLQDLKEIKLEVNQTRVPEDIFSECEYEIYGDGVVATHEDLNMRFVYAEEETSDEEIMTTMIIFDDYDNHENDTSTYIASEYIYDRNSWEMSDEKIYVSKDGVELDLNTNEKYFREDIIGDLSVEDKIGLLEIKNYYNDFVKETGHSLHSVNLNLTEYYEQ